MQGGGAVRQDVLYGNETLFNKARDTLEKWFLTHCLQGSVNQLLRTQETLLSIEHKLHFVVSYDSQEFNEFGWFYIWFYICCNVKTRIFKFTNPERHHFKIETCELLTHIQTQE